VQREAEHGLEFAEKALFGLVVDIIATQNALIRTLRGFTPEFGCFDDQHFDEHEIEDRLSSKTTLAIAACWYWIRKMQARYIADQYEIALEASLRAQRLIWTSPCSLRKRNITSTVRFAERQFGTLLQLRKGDRTWMPFLSTTNDWRSGQEIARKTSKTVPRWSVQKSRE
jgi:hypothetical protein